MTDKYVDVSLSTGLNDGSSQANAWQVFAEVLKNTMAAGSYVAGDTIHVRTADIGGNLSEALPLWGVLCAYNITGTDDNPLIFKFDTGDKWTESGVLTLTQANDDSYLNFTSGAIFRAVGYNFVIAGTITSGNQRFLRWVIAYGGKLLMEGTLFTAENGSAYNTCNIGFERNYIKFSKCKFKLGKAAPLLVKRDTTAVFEDCVFDFIKMTPSSTQGFVNVDERNISLTVIGGKVLNANSSVALVTKPDRATPEYINTQSSINGINLGVSPVEAGIGIDVINVGYHYQIGQLIYTNIAGTTGFYHRVNNALTEWDENGNYPYLNAILPDSSSSGWSVKVLPGKIASATLPARINNVQKYWNGISGKVDVKAEFLVKDTSGGTGAYDNITKEDCWIAVTYTRDSDGKSNTDISLKSSSALVTSLANWLPSASYGPDAYDEYMVELTTSEDVKADTIMSINTYFALPAINSTDFFFLCPDIVLVAV